MVTDYLTKEMEAGRVVVRGTSQDAGAFGAVHLVSSPKGVGQESGI